MAKLLNMPRFDGHLNFNWALLQSRQAAWLRSSDIFACALGTCVMAGIVLAMCQFDHRTSIDLWRARLSAEVRYRSWTIVNSLQESQDDMQVLADFAPSRELLLLATGENRRSPPNVAAVKQVTGLFENYRNVYEYAAIYLLDNQGQVVTQATNSGAWRLVIQSQEFQSIFHEAVRDRRYEVDLVPISGQALALAFVMPVRASGLGGKEPGASLGFVAMLSPLATELIPLLKADRVLTRTGETRLLQLQGGNPRYVSPGRSTSSDQVGRVPRADTLLRNAISADEDRPVFGTFRDSKGTGVMASMQKLAALNAVVVAKIDNSEAFGDFHRTVWLETIAAAAAILAYIGGILLHRRIAVVRAMRTTEESLIATKEALEMKVAERTTELGKLNEQLHCELAERQRAEQEVRELNSKLDQRVRDRSAQLETSNKELEAFAYTISHDLRAPLRAINGFSGILLEEYAPQLPGEAQRYLNVVSQQTKHMGQLIDSLLSFSRLNRLALRKESVAPSDLVRQAWESLLIERGDRQALLKIGDLPPCKGDPMLLKQVFVNLLSNALKYTRMRAIARIEVGSMDTGVYYVRDNGVGFDMQYRNKLFGVFQRLHPAEEYEGNGVGLAIVQRIVQRHGGRVWADAVLNQGATFYITLVREEVAQQAKHPPRSGGADQIESVGIDESRSLASRREGDPR